MLFVWVLAFSLLPSLDADGLINKRKHDQWQYAPTTTCDAGETQRCGPTQWHTVSGDAACKEIGTQSPIDATFSAGTVHPTFTVDDLQFQSHLPHCNVVEYELNEHTVEMALPPKEVTDSCFSATWNGKKYNLAQFHYHSPSEHTVDGKYYPIEVHHVHKAEDGQALVISVMVGVGDMAASQPATAADYMVNIFQKTPNGGVDKQANFHEDTEDVDWEAINPYTKFVPPMESKLYYYNGSFTTPSCNTDTVWLFAPTPVLVPESTLDLYRSTITSNNFNQLSTFGTIMGGSDTDVPTWVDGTAPTNWNAAQGCNNRPIQNLKGSQNADRKFYQIGSATDVNRAGRVGLAVAAVVVFLSLSLAGAEFE